MRAHAAPPKRRKPASKALVAGVVVLGLALAAGLGFAVRAGGDWWNPPDQAQGRAKARVPALEVPSGVEERLSPRHRLGHTGVG